jgi:hypothetical protein
MTHPASPFALPHSTYWRDTLRPWPNLLFVIPWLIVYEVGMWVSQVPNARNGADAWLRTTLVLWGAPGGWVLPVALLLGLLAWHLGSQQGWRVRWETLGGMFAESLLFACGLILFGQMVDLVGRRTGVLPVCEVTTWSQSASAQVLSFLGAGIYEEFLFRLCLIPAVFLLLRSLLVPAKWATAGSVIVTSLVFALAHYLVPSGEMTSLSVLSDAVAHVQSRRELWFGFGFRVAAGLIFGVLFCLRGFGVAMGTHALYDLVVGWLLVTEI